MKICRTVVMGDIAIPSTNYIYKAGIKGGKYPYLYKDEKVVKFQNYIIETLKGDKLLCKIGETNKSIPLALEVSFSFTFSKRFTLRDVSNAVKATEDALVEVIGVDDSRFFKVSADKKEGKEEKIEITLVLYSRDKECECGCGSLVKFGSDTKLKIWVPNKYILGHLSPEKKEEKRLKILETRGITPLESPYLPGRLIWFRENRGDRRWFISGKNGKGSTHARAIWLHNNGEIPEGFDVHHISGRTENIEDDALENLMLLPHSWNVKIFPSLALCFGILEEKVTQGYIDLGGEPREGVLKELCSLLCLRYGNNELQYS